VYQILTSIIHLLFMTGFNS